MSFKLRQNARAALHAPLDAFTGEDESDDGAVAGSAAVAASNSASAAAAAAAGGSGRGLGGLAGSGSTAPPAYAIKASVAELKERGVQAAQAGDYATALHAFAQALLHGEDARLEEMRAQVLLLLGRDFEAVQAAERATRLEPQWPDAWLTLARANLNLGEPQLAVENLQHLAEVAPGHEALQKDLPEAMMLAARQRQQKGGVRMQVVSANGGGAGAQDAPAGAEPGPGAAQGAGDDFADVDAVDVEPMDGVDITVRVWRPNHGAMAAGLDEEAEEAEGAEEEDIGD